MTSTLLKESEDIASNGNGMSQQADPVITDLLLIDRDVDYFSPLVSALNYEALLDEAFGIKCGP